jgi:hypothetical protein
VDAFESSLLNQIDNGGSGLRDSVILVDHLDAQSISSSQEQIQGRGGGFGGDQPVQNQMRD